MNLCRMNSQSRRAHTRHFQCLTKCSQYGGHKSHHMSHGRPHCSTSRKQLVHPAKRSGREMPRETIGGNTGGNDLAQVYGSVEPYPRDHPCGPLGRLRTAEINLCLLCSSSIGESLMGLSDQGPHASCIIYPFKDATFLVKAYHCIGA